jgi:hypothetical protein
MRVAIARGWLNAEGCSLYRVCLTDDSGGLLRAVTYQGQREDKPARQVVRLIPHS